MSKNNSAVYFTGLPKIKADDVTVLLAARTLLVLKFCSLLAIVHSAKVNWV